MAGERLLKVVLSFYREEPRALDRLEPLLACRLSRGWTALRIDCCDRMHLEQVNDLIDQMTEKVSMIGNVINTLYPA